jgi:hypothetical protein
MVKNSLAYKTFIIFIFFSIFIFLGSSNQKIIPIQIKNKEGVKVALYQESHALIIGIGEYTNGWPSLPGVKKDVDLVKIALENNGFNVVVKRDLNRTQLVKAYEDFINLYGHNPGNRLLFYFAGHGHTLKLAYGGNMGYIIPSDVPNPTNDEQGFLSKALDMKTIEVYAERIQSKHAIFLFDSCFSGSIFALSRAIPENISYKTAQPVRQFITSGSAEEQVPDESIFRYQFIEALNGEGDINKDGYLTGVELGEFLQAKVINYSKGSQHPQYGKIRNPYLDKGDFVFPLNSARLDTPVTLGINKGKDTIAKNLFTDGLLVNGDFKTHFLQGWQEFGSKQPGLAEISQDEKGLRLFYNGIGDGETKIGIKQTVTVDDIGKIFFQSEFKAIDNTLNGFPIVKLALINLNGKEIFQIVITEDKYYKSKLPFHRIDINLEEKENIKINFKKILNYRLNKVDIASIKKMIISYEIGPPKGYRCRQCSLQVFNAIITR